MEKLSPKDEIAISEFHEELGRLDGPDDMFPPEDGVREPRPEPPTPSTPNREMGAVAIYSAFAHRGQLVFSGSC